LILEHQATGTIAGRVAQQGSPEQGYRTGGYTVNVNLRLNRRAPDLIPEVGYAIVIGFGAG